MYLPDQWKSNIRRADVTLITIPCPANGGDVFPSLLVRVQGIEVLRDFLELHLPQLSGMRHKLEEANPVPRHRDDCLENPPDAKSPNCDPQAICGARRLASVASSGVFSSSCFAILPMSAVKWSVPEHVLMDLQMAFRLPSQGAKKSLKITMAQVSMEARRA